MGVLDLVAGVRDTRFSFGGNTYHFEPATPLDEQALAAVEAKACPRLPADYLEFVRTYGYANVFGAQLEKPIAVTRFDQSDVRAPAHAFVQFARRTPLLFAFYAEIPGGLVALGRQAEWPEPSAVVAVKAERLTGEVEHARLGNSFSTWLAFVIEMCRQRAAAT